MTAPPVNVPPVIDHTREWTSRLVVDWLNILGIGRGRDVDLPVFAGPYIPKDPDHLAVVTLLPGAGNSLDGHGDIPGFQLLVRSRRLDADSAEDAARRADRLIRFAPVPVTLGVQRLLRVMRVGGAPAVVGGEDDGDCTVVTCHYLTEIMETQQ